MTNPKRFFPLISLTTLISLTYFVTPALAVVDLPNSPTDKFGTGPQLPAKVISAFLLPILTIIGFLAALYIVLAGFKFVRSGGDPKAVEEARNRLLFAIVGFVILILAVAITQIIDKVILGGTGVI